MTTVPAEGPTTPPHDPARVGGALAVDTPVLTTAGWTTMGALAVGDSVFHPDGLPQPVVAVSEVLAGGPCYRVRFSDGAGIVADAEHQWVTRDYWQRQPRNVLAGSSVRTTREIADTLMARGGLVANHSVDVAAPLHFPPTSELPVPPYTLGVWLGAGDSYDATIICPDADSQILEEIRADGYTVDRVSGAAASWEISGERVGSLGTALSELHVRRHKHIPAEYLKAPVADRLALLQGLMDIGGTVGTRSARCEITLTNELLARYVHELVLGLGHKTAIVGSDATLNGRVVIRRWQVPFQTALPVFRLQRQLDKLDPSRVHPARRRYIVAVEPVDPVPVRCIHVDRPDGLYLAGRELITTHNSTPRLQHPRTGQPVDWFDPARHESPRWLGVRCSRCGRAFVCTPWDDLATPAPMLGWTGGDVCEPCLLTLAANLPRAGAR